MNQGLQKIAFDIFTTCISKSVQLEKEWIPRLESQFADNSSKTENYDVWGILEFLLCFKEIWTFVYDLFVPSIAIASRVICKMM